jgi:hypothetical protein
MRRTTLQFKARLLTLLAILICLLASISAAAAQTPEVIKVEPPGWWANHSINPEKRARINSLPAIVIDAWGFRIFVRRMKP